MKSVITILKEQKQYFYLTRRLAKYEMKTKNENSYLGALWEYINPLIQLLVYWFVFQNVMQRSSITMRDGSEVPFICWLLVGFVVITQFEISPSEIPNAVPSSEVLTISPPLILV